MNSTFSNKNINKKLTNSRRNSRQSFLPEPLRVIVNSFSPYWAACIPLSALIVVLWNSAAQAQGYGLPENATPEQIQTNLQIVLDTTFLLASSILVIFMNAGFGMLETGFCRQKNAVNILAKNLIVFAIATIAYWAIGYGLMYGEGSPFIGTQGFFFNGSSVPYTGAESFQMVGDVKLAIAVPESISFLFQVAFAATAATIVSGAVAERIHFGAFLIFSIF